MTDRQLEWSTRSVGVQPVTPQHRVPRFATHTIRDGLVRRSDRNRLRRFGDRLGKVRVDHTDDGVGPTAPPDSAGEVSTGWATHGLHVGQIVADRLMFPDRLVEALPLLA